MGLYKIMEQKLYYSERCGLPIHARVKNGVELLQIKLIITKNRNNVK